MDLDVVEISRNFKGIRVFDEKDGEGILVQLTDILAEIQNGDTFHWSMLYLWATGDLGEGPSIPVFEEEIRSSKNGLFISWQDLNALSKNFYQVIEIGLIGCKDSSFLKRYANDRERYENCDYIIDMIDGDFWEIFSKDKKFLHGFVKKFKQIEFLDDFPDET